MKTSHRERKTLLYTEAAKVGIALGSPIRLELLELLAQRERSVEDIAGEADLGIPNASRHLAVLARAHLVRRRRDGNRIFYRTIPGLSPGLLRSLRDTAIGTNPVLATVLGADFLVAGDADAAMRTAVARGRAGHAVLVDVRPRAEFETAHLPGAVSVPLQHIVSRGSRPRLPRDRELLVYCRGAFCAWADEAATVLRRRGFNANVLPLGPSEIANIGA
ncbi:ArsR family transcriptional regulator [Vulcanimicrobium alpinum]|uniref:ArsR family transcriptional regulator n=1 Tax=Vulcanimicrobium alpinum TaxID=3016050 RepID=A0AAN1XVE0_UNVUL|nr:ArsR family transcriptional regulator [Vulcanimicrobium alpinum]